MEAMKVIVSEVTRGEEVSVEWELKDWKDNFEHLANLTRCPLKVDFGPQVGVVELSFFFRSISGARRSRNNNRIPGCQYEREHFLSLCVAVLLGNSPVPLSFRLETKTTNPNGTNLQISGFHFADINSCFSIRSKDGEPTVVKEHFIKHKIECLDGYQSHLCYQPLVSNSEIKISISIVPWLTTGTAECAGDIGTSSQEASIFTDLKVMYGSEDNFADLKLEMKDNMTLSAHRFILAARSEVLKDLITSEVNKKGFDGTIKISNVNAKPMLAILHWMYTGELQENAGNFMMETVEGAIHFRLNGMLQILDKQLVSVCNKENMFQLFQVADKNALPTAKVQLAQYIKENLI